MTLRQKKRSRGPHAGPHGPLAARPPLLWAVSCSTSFPCPVSYPYGWLAPLTLVCSARSASLPPPPQSSPDWRFRAMRATISFKLILTLLPGLALGVQTSNSKAAASLQVRLSTASRGRSIPGADPSVGRRQQLSLARDTTPSRTSQPVRSFTTS